MAEPLRFDRDSDISVVSKLPYPPASRPRAAVMEEKAPYLVSQSTATVNNTDLWRLEAIFMEFQQVVSRVQEYETEIPDVFDLRPLSSQRITLKIREIKPAQFYYVTDIDDDDEE